MPNNNWKKGSVADFEDIPGMTDDLGGESTIDFKDYNFDQISKRIVQKFKCYRIEERLKAKEFTTYSSPEETDHGVDLLEQGCLYVNHQTWPH
jgi:restriction system protein